MRNALNPIRAVLALALAPLMGCAERAPDDPWPATGETKTFELSVDEFDWKVGPGAVYKAIGYNQQVPGPLLEVNAGDHVVVRLTNNTSEPHSVHTHVVQFTSANDGTHDSLVQPGETRTFEWDAVFAGTFPYHDHGGAEDAVSRGMYGMVVVHAPDEEPANEHIVLLADFGTSSYRTLPGVVDPTTGMFPPEGTYRGGHQYMHTINGKAYEDAVPAFTGKVGELQRWRVVSLGPEFHTWHIHGHRWIGADGHLTDNVTLQPGGFTTFEFEEDNPGDWLVHCHVANHMEGGMIATYTVSP